MTLMSAKMGVIRCRSLVHSVARCDTLSQYSHAVIRFLARPHRHYRHFVRHLSSSGFKEDIYGAAKDRDKDKTQRADDSQRSLPVSEEPAEDEAEEAPRINVVYDLGDKDKDNDELMMFERWAGRAYEVTQASERTVPAPNACGVSSLDKWLQKYRPSKFLWDYQYKALYIGKMAREKRNDFSKFEQLDEDWERLKKSAHPVNFHTVSEMAKNLDILRGKWMAFFDDAASIDTAWGLVASAIYHGRLGPYTVAKVKLLPIQGWRESRTFFLNVFTKDYTDEPEIRKVESQLRDAGLECFMSYKPDFYSRLVINRGNKWNIRPSLYGSTYDELTQRSKVIKLR